MVDNQHKKITGYRDLTEVEIAEMNNAKALAIKVGAFVENMESFAGADKRWLAIAKTQLQQGFMALIRSIAKPETF